MFLATQLCGFMAGGSSLTSITQVLSATSTGTNITAPSGIQAGDLIVLYDCATAAIGSVTEVTPTDFNSIAAIAVGTNARAVASWKLALGTEGSSSITGMAAAGAGSTTKVMYVFRGDIPASLITVASTNSQGTSGNPTAQTVTSSSGVAPLVILGFYAARDDITISPRTFTVGGVGAKDAELESNGTFGDTWVAYKIYNSSPQNASIDMDDEGSANLLVSCYIQMS